MLSRVEMPAKNVLKVEGKSPLGENRDFKRHSLDELGVQAEDV